MRVLPVSNNALAEAVEILRTGGVVAHATETCYGLACDIANQQAVEKLFAIKQRPQDQAVSALFASKEDTNAYVQWNQKATALAEQHLPGPLTLILPLTSTLFPTPQGGDSLGVRISSHADAQALVEMFGAPLTTTSANIHGAPNPYSVEEILSQYEGHTLQPDLLLDSGALPEAPASSVVQTKGDDVLVLRKGELFG